MQLITWREHVSGDFMYNSVHVVSVCIVLPLHLSHRAKHPKSETSNKILGITR